MTSLKTLSPPWFARVLLLAVGLIWGCIGLLALWDPKSIGHVINFGLETPLARLEFRAQYGGFCVALGILHFVAASREAWLRLGLAATAVLFGGLLFGRFVSLAIDPSYSPQALSFVAAESVTLVALVVAWVRLSMHTRDAAPPAPPPAA